MKMKFGSWLLGLAVVGATALPTMAQAGGGGGGGGGGGRGGRGGRGGAAFDPAAQMQNRLDALKTLLAPKDDDEWKLLSDKITKVLTLQNEIQAGAGRGGLGRGGRGGRGGAAPAAPDPSNPIAVAAADLTTVVQNTTAAPDDIKVKMAALRDARKKIEGQLTAAQDDLKGITTVRQEAVLVSQGILD